MAFEEVGHLADAHVTLGPAAEGGHQLSEGQGAAVMRLEGLAQDDGVDRGQAQVGEEASLGADRARVFVAVEAGEDRGDVREDLVARSRRCGGTGEHQSILSARVQAHAKSPRRAVNARTGRSFRSGQAAASSRPRATETAPVAASAPTTDTAFGPPTSPRPVALAT